MANYNPRLAKINQSYLVEEIADLYGVHKNTVRNWLRNGLERCDDRKPILVLGKELRRFLESKRQKNKKPCKPGEIYCVRCRIPVTPESKGAVLEVSGGGGAMLRGVCSTCSCTIFRKVSLSKISVWKGDLSLKEVEA